MVGRCTPYQVKHADVFFPALIFVVPPWGVRCFPFWKNEKQNRLRRVPLQLLMAGLFRHQHVHFCNLVCLRYNAGTQCSELHMIYIYIWTCRILHTHIQEASHINELSYLWNSQSLRLQRRLVILFHQQHTQWPYAQTCQCTQCSQISDCKNESMRSACILPWRS